MAPKLAGAKHPIQGLGRKMGVGKEAAKGKGQRCHRREQSRERPRKQQHPKGLQRRGVEGAAGQVRGKFTQAIARMFHYEALLPLQRKGQKRPKGEASGKKPEHMDLEAGPVAPGEREAHVSIARVDHTKGQGAIHQPR